MYLLPLTRYISTQVSFRTSSSTEYYYSIRYSFILLL